MKMRVGKEWKFLERLILSVIICGFAVICSAQFAGGNGTELDPWLIETAEHLSNIRNYVGAANNDKYFVQRANINLGAVPWNEGAGWQPIGSASNAEFRGKYDGSIYTINGLTINRSGANYQGLFGFVYGAAIKNVGLKDVNIVGNQHIGGLAGWIRYGTTIGACFVTGSITSNHQNVGGLVGNTGNMRDPVSNISDCYSTASITNNTTTISQLAGGIVGNLYLCNLHRSYAIGRVETFLDNPSNVGAVIGASSGTVANIYWCTDTGAQTLGVGSSAAYPGNSIQEMLLRETYEGFDFGEIWMISERESLPYLQWQGDEPAEHNLPPLLPPVDLRADFEDGNVRLRWNAPPDVFGVPDGYNVYRDGNRVNDEQLAGREYQDIGLESWLIYNYSVSAVYGENESMLSAKASVKTYSFAGGSGTVADPFLVQSAEQLNGLRFFLNLHYKQIGNIDLDVPPYNEGAGWVPIGTITDFQFLGSYNGDGYTINGLYLNRPTVQYQALFGYIAGGAIIRNVGVTNIDVTAGINTAGLLAGCNDGTVDNCYTTGVVRGTAQTGGLVGNLFAGTIGNSYSTCSVTGTNTNTGGLVGYSRATILNCFSTGNVTGAANYTGGLVGNHYTNGEISNSYSRSRVQGTRYVGGFVGSTRAPISFCYSTGLVIGVQDVGGFAGENLNAVGDSYWDVNASQQEESAGGLGRTTGQMVYPYDETTYIDWDFEEIWFHDTTRLHNNGYPMLSEYDYLNTPEVKIEIRTIENIRYSYISWEPVEGAASYKIYGSNEPYPIQWGAPIDIIGETNYIEQIPATGNRFFYVVASSEETP